MALVSITECYSLADAGYRHGEVGEKIHAQAFVVFVQSGCIISVEMYGTTTSINCIGTYNRSQAA